MNEWALAAEALEWSQSRLGGRIAAKLLLADAMRDGLIRARADTSWTAETERPSWKAPDTLERNVSIRKSDLWLTRDWSHDQSEWRWGKSNFLITLNSQSYQRRYYKHVHLSSSDVERIARDSGSGLKGKGRGGRNKNVLGWRELWFFLIQAAKSDTLDTEHFADLKTFQKEIQKVINSGLSAETVRPELAAVWKRFVNPT